MADPNSEYDIVTVNPDDIVATPIPNEPADILIKGTATSLQNKPALDDLYDYKTVDASAIRAINTPYDNKDSIDDYQSVGIGPDKLPIKNVQAVNSFTRWATQFAFTTPQEKALYLQKTLGPNWDVAQDPNQPLEVIVKRKGDKEWGVVDPGNLTWDEYLPEAAEHATEIAQLVTLPATWWAGGLTAGGLQAARQAIKQALLPGSSIDKQQLAIDTVSGMVGSGLTSVLKGTGKKAVQEASSTLGRGVQSVAGEEGLLTKLGNKLNVLDKPERIVEEIHGGKRAFDPTIKGNLVNKVATLQKEYPEFMELYNAKWTLKGKFESLNKLLQQTGDYLGSVYSNQTIKIPVRDILDSESAKLLKEASKSRVVKQGDQLVRVNQKTVNQIQAVQHDFIEDLATTVIGDNPTGKKFLDLFRKGKLHKDPEFKSMGITTNNDAMIAVIGDHELTLQDVVATRLGRDNLLKYGKQKGQISTKNTADKYTADALRDAIHKGLRENLGEDGEAVIKQMELYHNLAPVVKQMGGAIGGDAAATWNPVGKLIPGLLNGPVRWTAKFGVNLSNRLEVRNFVRKLTEQSGAELPKEIDAGLSKSTSLMERVLRGTKFRFTQEVLGKGTDEAQALPRDADAFFENPDQINKLSQIVKDPELTSSLIKQYERGDKEGFANTLSMVASNEEDAFEVAPYKSLIVQNGKLILMDKYDREQYRQHITKTVIDPLERYTILNSLNLTNEMVKPPFSPSIPKLKQSENQPVTTVGRVAESLKQADTIQLDDGTTRVEYDY